MGSKIIWLEYVCGNLALGHFNRTEFSFYSKEWRLELNISVMTSINKNKENKKK